MRNRMTYMRISFHFRPFFHIKVVKVAEELDCEEENVLLKTFNVQSPFRI
ncbi:hypothetical protein [Pseudalkalibacillus caeni]|nr:hypothetical protein [Pseudalkalibacillus caeni]